MGQFEASSATKLFERVPGQAYLEEWTKILAHVPENAEEIKEASYVIFRLSKDWFALSTLAFSNIGSERTINLLPYHEDPAILGIVNLQGQLRLCFSMHILLGVEAEEKKTKEESTHYKRLLAISNESDLWTFPADEVLSVVSLDVSKTANVPVNLLNAKENYLKSVFTFNEKKIYIIDEEMLFMSLRRRLT
jgi:chemotaxis-related protein WspD